MWTISSLDDPIHHGSSHASASPSEHYIVHAKVPFATLLAGTDEQISKEVLEAFQQGERPARVALADFCSRLIGERFRKNLLVLEQHVYQFALEPLEYAGSPRRRKQSNFTGNHTPYILERSDFFCTEEDLVVTLRARVTAVSSTSFQDEKKIEGINQNSKTELELATAEILSKHLGPQNESFALNVMNHVACVVVQNRLRQVLAAQDAVAFIADGSILPRKSGANNAPMASPPAVPSEAPADSTMKQTLQVDLGLLRKFLRVNTQNENGNSNPNGFSITGMVIQKGITLIAGGGYHGKVRTC